MPIRFLQAGASKVFISSRDVAACEEACEALNRLPNRSSPDAIAIPVPADSSNLAGVTQLFKQVEKHTDRVDILLANAGATWAESIDTHSDEAFARVMDLNVRAVFNTVRLFCPLLEKAGSVQDPSRIIITASAAALSVATVGKIGTYGYSASKAAVVHLGRNLAVELGPRHITTNSICPGYFPTKMTDVLLGLPGAADKIAGANPMGRLGVPEDIAGIVVFLASRAGAHVNGETIAVDGGALWVRGELALLDSLIKL